MTFDNTLPADNRRWDLAAGDIRANNDALEAVFGVDLDTSTVTVPFDGITANTGTITALTSDDIITKGPFHDIRAYGGGTSESASTNATAIQAAITAAQGNGTVLLPPGEYTIDTGLTVTDAINIWGPGATIKQEFGAGISQVLLVAVAGNKDISLNVKINGNKDEITPVEGVILRGINKSQGMINVTAINCDIGIVIEGNTEGNTMFLNAFTCVIGVIERISGVTPDENTYFIDGKENTTHYQKESIDTQITSYIHFSCEQSTGYSIILNGGQTTMAGFLRACGTLAGGGGLKVTGDGDVATIFVIFNNLRLLSVDDNGWGVIIDDSNFIHGSVITENFDGGVWVKRADRGRLQVEARSTNSLPALRLGNTSEVLDVVNKFHVTQGTYLSSNTSPSLHLARTQSCTIDAVQISSAVGDEILLETTANDDTIRMPDFTDISVDDSSTSDHTIEFYGKGLTVLDDTGTPSVLGRTTFAIGGTTAITDFLDGYISQIITIIGTGAGALVTHNTNFINLAGGVNFNVVTGDTLVLIFNGTDWNEISRSDNTVA